MNEPVKPHLKDNEGKSVEEALRESEERYRSFISQVSDGVYRFELTEPMPVDLPIGEQIDFIYDHTRLAECNPAFLRMYNIEDPADLIGKSLLALHGSRDNPVNRESQRQFLLSGFKTENKITEEIDAAGNRKYFSNNVLGIIENGHVVRLWGTQTDVTESRRTEEALRKKSCQLSDLAAQITLIEHRERRRLADLLHDHLQQNLVGARMQVHALVSASPQLERKTLAGISEILAEACETARSISRDIAPPVAVHGNLPDAFRWLVLEFRRRHQCTVHARIKGNLSEVPEAESIFLFTTARELLLNVVKHANVPRADLELERRSNAVVLRIRDCGCGFDPGSMASRVPCGFGLFSIRDRVELLGGSYTLVSRPNHGTIVTVSVPIPAPPPPPHPVPRKVSDRKSLFRRLGRSPR